QVIGSFGLAKMPEPVAAPADSAPDSAAVIGCSQQHVRHVLIAGSPTARPNDEIARLVIGRGTGIEHPSLRSYRVGREERLLRTAQPGADDRVGSHRSLEDDLQRPQVMQALSRPVCGLRESGVPDHGMVLTLSLDVDNKLQTRIMATGQ